MTTQTIVGLLVRIFGLVLLYFVIAGNVQVGIFPFADKNAIPLNGFPVPSLMFFGHRVFNSYELGYYPELVRGVAAFIFIFFPKFITNLLFKGL